MVRRMGQFIRPPSHPGTIMARLCRQERRGGRIVPAYLEAFRANTVDPASAYVATSRVWAFIPTAALASSRGLSCATALRSILLDLLTCHWSGNKIWCFKFYYEPINSIFDEKTEFIVATYSPDSFMWTVTCPLNRTPYLLPGDDILADRIILRYRSLPFLPGIEKPLTTSIDLERGHEAPDKNVCSSPSNSKIAVTLCLKLPSPISAGLHKALSILCPCTGSAKPSVISIK